MANMNLIFFITPKDGKEIKLLSALQKIIKDGTDLDFNYSLFRENIASPFVGIATGTRFRGSDYVDSISSIFVVKRS